MPFTFHVGRKTAAGEEDMGRMHDRKRGVQKKWERGSFPCEFLTYPHFFCREFFSMSLLD